jgi:hypothetical protein
MKFTSTIILAVLLTAGSIAAPPGEEELLRKARERMSSRRIDPASTKLSIRHYPRAEDFFRDKPRNTYWDEGRRVTGRRAIVAISYSPVRPMLGGVGTFLFDKRTRKLLWTYGGR